MVAAGIQGLRSFTAPVPRITSRRLSVFVRHRPLFVGSLMNSFCCVVTHISPASDELEQLRIAFDLLLDSCRSFPNNVQDKFRLGQHGDMTTVGFEDCCPHSQWPSFGRFIGFTKSGFTNPRGTRTVQRKSVLLCSYRFLTRPCSATAALYLLRVPLGVRPFTAVTRVQIPSGTPNLTFL